MSTQLRTVYLLPCASRKRNARAPARDLYESPLFRKMRAVAEETGAPWFILSAKHGLLEPGQQVDPYDLTLNDMRVSERRSWARGVIAQMERSLPPVDRVVVLAGQKYREFLMDWLTRISAVVDTPLAHLPIGLQLQFLDAWLAGLPQGHSVPPPVVRAPAPPASSGYPGNPPDRPRAPAGGSAAGPSKYRALHDFLAARSERIVELPCSEIALMVGQLPRSAYARRPWWANVRSSPQARAWLDAGRRASVDWEARTVRFLADETG